MRTGEPCLRSSLYHPACPYIASPAVHKTCSTSLPPELWHEIISLLPRRKIQRLGLCRRDDIVDQHIFSRIRSSSPPWFLPFVCSSQPYVSSSCIWETRAATGTPTFWKSPALDSSSSNIAGSARSARLTTCDVACESGSSFGRQLVATRFSRNPGQHSDGTAYMIYSWEPRCAYCGV